MKPLLVGAAYSLVRRSPLVRSTGLRNDIVCQFGYFVAPGDDKGYRRTECQLPVSPRASCCDEQALFFERELLERVHDGDINTVAILVVFRALDDCRDTTATFVCTLTNVSAETHGRADSDESRVKFVFEQAERIVRVCCPFGEPHECTYQFLDRYHLFCIVEGLPWLVPKDKINDTTFVKKIQEVASGV